MKRGFLLGLAAVLAGSLGVTVAAQGRGQASLPTKPITVKAERTPVKTVKVEVPIVQAVRSDTQAFRGEAWFQQKCGLCHLGRWRKEGQLQPFAATMAGVLKGATPAREAAIRAQVQKGSLNMPGFENAFTPAEFEELIAYLKTL